MSRPKIRVKVSGRHSETAYVKLPGHPDETDFGIVSHTVRIENLIRDFRGPMGNLDFNKDGVLIGTEILA